MASSSALPEQNPSNIPVNPPAAVTPAETVIDIDVEASPLEGATLPSAPSNQGMMIRIDPVETKALAPTAPSMRAILASAENGAEYLAEAQQLADKIELSNLSTILEHGQASRDAISSVSTDILGDRKIGEAGPIEALFTDLTNIHQALNFESLKRPLTKFQEILGNFTNYFHPVVAFARRYQAIVPQIDAKEVSLRTLEADSVENQNELKALKGAILNGFRSLEVSIAAGEIVLEREGKKFEADREAIKDSFDIVKRQELNDRRLALMNLDNRVMRLQTARIDSIMDLPMIDMALDNEVKLRGTLEDIRTITIPQIRKGVVIATNIFDQRRAAQIAGRADQFNDILREANLHALGLAQQETHQLATGAARNAPVLIKGMEKLIELVNQGHQLIEESKALNANARADLAAAEKKFKIALTDALN